MFNEAKPTLLKETGGSLDDEVQAEVERKSPYFKVRKSQQPSRLTKSAQLKTYGGICLLHTGNGTEVVVHPCRKGKYIINCCAVF